MPPEHGEVARYRAAELAQRRGLTSALAVRWSDGGKQAEPRWFWPASDHHRGAGYAYVCGRRKEAVCLARQGLLESCGSSRFSTAGWGSYERHLTPEQPTVGTQHTPKIARQHSNPRTRSKRLVRRTMCFSNTTTMHELVIGLFVNRYEFGLAL